MVKGKVHMNAAHVSGGHRHWSGCTVVHVCIVYSVQCREDPVCGRGGGGGERSRGWRAR